MGLSKFRDANQATVATMTPHPTGTYPYMAPEMFSANHRGTGVDIYSYGCLIIEVFGQKRVWGDLSGINIMYKACGSYNNNHCQLSTCHCTVKISANQILFYGYICSLEQGRSNFCGTIMDQFHAS